MKQLVRMSILGSILGVAATAYATEYNKTGTIGEIKYHATWGYDEFLLVGAPDVCGSAVETGWRSRVRLTRTAAGYEHAMKAVLAAKLSGAQVRVVAEDDADDRCALKHLEVLE